MKTYLKMRFCIGELQAGVELSEKAISWSDGQELVDVAEETIKTAQKFLALAIERQKELKETEESIKEMEERWQQKIKERQK